MRSNSSRSTRLTQDSISAFTSGRGAPSRPEGAEGHRERTHVGQHVPAVGKESQAAGQKPAHDLGDHVGRREAQDELETPPVRVSFFQERGT